jgi:2-polyprenyl-3-methyl-5-hydroxy-6-metoxy-1,4-benzoquinol methylase
METTPIAAVKSSVSTFEQGTLTNLLPFSLPDFTRVSWVSDRAQSVWGPRIDRIKKAWFELEWMSVSAGLRRCAITTISPEEFLLVGPRWAESGLNATPLEIQGVSQYSYSSTPVRAELGLPYVFRVVLGDPKYVAKFKTAWDSCADEEMGAMLGYPCCCSHFFKHTWVDRRLTDTTWAMALNGSTVANTARQIEVNSSPLTNILWRWTGIRAVFHLPCGFHCPTTERTARLILELGSSQGYKDEMEWLLNILSWPVEWSALHGIAEIKTPILKVTTRTDATAVKYVVRRAGTGYPEEGPNGTNFPYRRPQLFNISGSAAYQRGIANPLIDRANPPSWYALDNGFPSVSAMEDAHNPMVALTSGVLQGAQGRVLDLGCGNGALLKRLSESRPAVEMFGIDLERVRILHARQLNPRFSNNFIIGDMFTSTAFWENEFVYDLAILMPGRLLEVSSDEAAALLTRLRMRSKRLAVYAYGDWLTRYNGLAELSHQAGLAILDLKPGATVAFATVK